MKMRIVTIEREVWYEDGHDWTEQVNQGEKVLSVTVEYDPSHPAFDAQLFGKPSNGEFPPGVDMCRDCGGAHKEGECPLDCEHKNVSQEDWGGEERAFLCLDCDNWVSPTGPDDEEGHPTWEIA